MIKNHSFNKTKIKFIKNIASGYKKKYLEKYWVLESVFFLKLIEKYKTMTFLVSFERLR